MDYAGIFIGNLLVRNYGDLGKGSIFAGLYINKIFRLTKSVGCALKDYETQESCQNWSK